MVRPHYTLLVCLAGEDILVFGTIAKYSPSSGRTVHQVALGCRSLFSDGHLWIFYCTEPFGGRQRLDGTSQEQAANQIQANSGWCLEVLAGGQFGQFLYRAVAVSSLVHECTKFILVRVFDLRQLGSADCTNKEGKMNNELSHFCGVTSFGSLGRRGGKTRSSPRWILPLECERFDCPVVSIWCMPRVGPPVTKERISFCPFISQMFKFSAVVSIRPVVAPLSLESVKYSSIRFSALLSQLLVFSAMRISLAC